MDRVVLVLALLLASALALAQPAVDSRALYQEAASAEQRGNMKEATRLYVRAARAGNQKAASRLAEIYDKGAAARMLRGPPMIGDFPDPKRGY